MNEYKQQKQKIKCPQRGSRENGNLERSLEKFTDCLVGEEMNEKGVKRAIFQGQGDPELTRLMCGWEEKAGESESSQVAKSSS